jgi:CBS domain containing-hemolysin-like protein
MLISFSTNIIIIKYALSYCCNLSETTTKTTLKREYVNLNQKQAKRKSNETIKIKKTILIKSTSGTGLFNKRSNQIITSLFYFKTN